jgi:uncharacterized repeat protein (TIGR01451 family)
MKRVKLAVGLALVAFLLTSAASSAWAFWSAQANVSSTTKVASLASACSNVTSVVNASFEQPVITQDWTWIANGGVPGWVSTDPVGIEIWQNGYDGVNAPVGNQFVELNANQAGTLSQSISTTPGQILQWSLLHRGRAGVDTMQVLIGSSNSTLVPIRTISDGTSAWGRYSGAYVVPASQTTTELAFRALSTGSGDLSVGNFMDDVSFGSGPCLTAASTVSNLTNPGSTAYHLGDVVQYSTTVSNIGSALSYQSVLSDTLSPSVAFKAGSLTIDGTARTDAGGDDQAQYAAGAVTARLGSAASATAGGTIAQSTSTTVTFQATVVGSVGAIAHFAPTVDYVNGLAPLWAVAPAVSPDVPFTITLGVDVGVTASMPSPSTLTAGVATSSTWSFVVKNNGAITANNVVVHVSEPTGFSVTAAAQITGGAACTVTSATTADCTVGDLAAAASKTITVAGRAAAGTTAGPFAVVAAVTSTSGDPTSANNSATGTATLVADTSVPTTVTGLAVTGTTTGNQAALKWTAATDNAAVAGYNVYRDNVLIATVTGTTYTDALLNPSTAYVYKIKAVDVAGNLSTAFSNSVTVTTTATFTATTNYQVSYPGSSLCIDTSVVPPLSGSTLVLATCDTTQYQKWSFVKSLNSHTASTNNYFVAPEITSTVLGWDILNSGTADYAKADVHAATGTTQEWKPVVEAGGTYHFINLNSGLCLDVNGNVPSLGLQLQQYDCNGTGAQSFTITAVN